MSVVIRARKSAASQRRSREKLQPAAATTALMVSLSNHDAVAVAALEVIAAHAVLCLEVADHRLDGGAPPHLAADGSGDTPHLAEHS